MRHRSLLILPLLTAAALLLGACGDDGDNADDTTTTAAEGGSSDEMSLDGVTLVNDGQITVCSDMPYEPFEFEEDGETKGFDYDVVVRHGRSARRRRGVRHHHPVRRHHPRTRRGQLRHDRLGHDHHRGARRAGRLHRALLRRRPVVAGAAPRTRTPSPASTTSPASGSACSRARRARPTPRRTLPTTPRSSSSRPGDEMFPALISGDIDAALQDLPVNGYRAPRRTPTSSVVTATFSTGEQYGFAVAKDSALLSPPGRGTRRDPRRRHLRRGVHHLVRRDPGLTGRFG
jgi:hypothetical protein